MSSGKKMLYDIKAEESVIGALLIDDVIGLVIDMVDANDFYDTKLGTVFKAIKTLYENNINSDLVTLANKLNSDGNLEQVGGVDKIMSLSNLMSSSANIEFHARIVKQLSLKRYQHKMAEKLIEASQDATEDVFETTEWIEKQLDVLNAVVDNPPIRGDRAVEELLELILEMKANKDIKPINGIDTGFKQLNEMTNGWQKSNLIILAARPSMGKTSLATNMICNSKSNVLFFSIEMSRDQVIKRFMAAECKIELSRMRSGNLSNVEMDKIFDMKNKMSRIVIDDSPNISLGGIRARAKQIAKQPDGLDMIVIDYLQYIKTPRTNGNKNNEIGAITRGLKSLSKELDIPIIALSQLSRAVEQRPDKKPKLSDLRESGEIEQDADVVVFLTRPDYYEENPVDENGESLRGKTTIIIGKQRDGKTGEFNINFNGDYTLFFDDESKYNYAPITRSQLDRIKSDTFDSDFIGEN